MPLLADRVSVFIEHNRKYEVLGLFILLIVGVVSLSDGGHEAHLSFFGFAVEPMSKATFYVALLVLAVDILQSRYQDKLATERARAQQAVARAAKEWAETENPRHTYHSCTRGRGDSLDLWTLVSSRHSSPNSL